MVQIRQCHACFVQQHVRNDMKILKNVELTWYLFKVM